MTKTHEIGCLHPLFARLDALDALSRAQMRLEKAERTLRYASADYHDSCRLESTLSAGRQDYYNEMMNARAEIESITATLPALQATYDYVLEHAKLPKARI